ncbi:hypothetical protein ALT_0272 [Aspergillus lentulus]|uniref:FAD-binding domain-containing protein n=1 Tax=Aspergillus lentulus TaxID=293939 RepID=A0AAN4PBF9_ASPLE|nr:hypothetical protein CNMCM6069_006321 [Aspergillus lentulus]KAF4176127.1 hypothetical protein CNMCM8060_006544 [Aspergillus lentulus]KAF4187028.1 hypothetical protein CNMCM7927_004591 [Aspergillus lentulus]KAF4198697.1 hypothetical protein CNMCM8694_008743 [Aspergillus lentulus]GAQ02951.1 hypothetical protein ALT_0272 [Aspergillus lentulus]
MGIYAEKGVITFTNGTSVQHDIVVGADGVGSSVRRSFGIPPERKRATATCYYCLITSSDVQRLGLSDMMRSDAIEYWGNGEYKVVLSACRGGSVQLLFIFSPASPEDIWQNLETCDAQGISDQVLQPFPGLDPRIRRLVTHAIDIRPWRLFEHSPFPTWHMGRVCLMGDAAHPMMPDQSQDGCQSIEDAAALGIIFFEKYKFTSDVNAGLCVYERVRKPRANKVQAASA